MERTNDRASLQRRLQIAFETDFPFPAETEPHLSDALSETLRRPGNLIRAQLAYSVARTYHLSDETARQIAIALEYFHTASLLFDDLPSMDDATHRRGHLCIHRLHGEGSAILAALGLINRAYALLWKSVAGAAPACQTKALAYVERYLGLGGLLSGQSHDLHYAHLPPAERSPQQVAMGKTVSLIRLSLVLPAIVGGADARAVRLLDRLAVIWGLAYQALDDLKDVLHETARAGKTTARDTLLDRPNLALTLGPIPTLERLQRLIHLGERLVTRLRCVESSLLCLEVPRHRLQLEVADLEMELMGAKH